MSRSAAITTVGAALLCGLFLSSFASGQSAGPSQRGIADPVTRVLDDPDDTATINRILGAGVQPASVVAARARRLIDDLCASRFRKPAPRPAIYIAAIQQISGLASRALSGAAILGVAVAPGYRPANAVAALDFGPPDGPVMEGFEGVFQGDPRLEGNILALKHPDTSPLLSDGLAGIEQIRLPVQPGDYRIILLTQNLANPAVSKLPFGREVRVNGVSSRVERAEFARWQYDAILADRPGPGGEGVVKLPGFGAELFARQQGGALVLEATATSDTLTIQLSDFAGARSYLTGLVVERLDRPSGISLSPLARRVVISLQQRLELETTVLEAAARCLEKIPPEAGPPDEPPPASPDA